MKIINDKKENKIEELAVFATDAYKYSHRLLYPKGTEYVYSNMTPRINSYFRYSYQYTTLGVELFVERFLIKYFNDNFFNLPWEDIEVGYSKVITDGLGKKVGDIKPIKELYDLGYLPLEIKALPEGIQVPVGVPMLTIINTKPEFFWLTNFIETSLLSEVYPVFNAASIARQFKKVAKKYSSLTCDDDSHIPWQFHDFSRRGQHGNDSGLTISLGHLTSFSGTDSVQGAVTAYNYYDAEDGVFGSVVASEHSVASSYGDEEGEFEYYKTLIENNPEGILSLVSDTYDYYNVLTNILPKLKQEILARSGKLVVRPDSGNIEEILSGNHQIDITENTFISDLLKKDTKLNEFVKCTDTVNKIIADLLKKEMGKVNNILKRLPSSIIKSKEYYYELGYDEDQEIFIKRVKDITPEQKGSLRLLWETFGGTVNSKGYKVLDKHIGILYGEGITLDNIESIMESIKEAGFAVSNVVFGVGAYSYSVFNTRDTFGTAFKTTLVVVNGEERKVSKHPKGVDFKRSAKGKVAVVEFDGEIKYMDDLSLEDEVNEDMLETVFLDGKRTRFTKFSTIRERIDQELNK